MNINSILDISKDEVLSLIKFFEMRKSAFFILDKNFIMTYANPQTANLLGMKRKEIIGKMLWEIPLIGEEFLTSGEYCMAIENGIPRSWEVFSKSTNIWAKTSVYPLGHGGSLVNIKDMTEKKHKELKLRENEYLFRTSLEKIDEAFMIIELLYDEAGNINDYKYIKVNEALEKYTGLDSKDLIGKTVSQTHLKIESSWLANYDNVNKMSKKTGEPKHFINFNKATGCWHDVFCFPYDNNRIGVFFRNITEKMQAREALRRSRKKYRDFMMACFDSVYRINPDWSQVNILKEDGVSIDREDMGSGWVDIDMAKKHAHPDERSHILDKINNAILNKDILDLEYRILNENGDLEWIHLRTVPIMDKNGDIIEWLAAVSNITPKKEFELKLIEKEKEHLQVRDSSTLGSVIIDFKNKEYHISDEWKKRLGLENLDSKEMFFKPLSFIHPEDARRVASIRRNSIRRKKPRYVTEYRAKTVDSGYIWVIGQTKILYDNKGMPTKAYGTHIDITERRLAEEALRESKRRAQGLITRLRKLSEHRKNLISILSHEFRNSLATITMALSFSEQIVSECRREMQMRGIIKRQTAHLMRLVDDLLDVARIEKNKIKLEKKDIEINETVKKTVDDFRGQFDTKGVTLKGEYCENLIYINADPVRIRQVIENLLSNSLKFTEEGGRVKLTISKDEHSKDVVIKVSDTGIGIDPKFSLYLFESFAQEDSSPIRETGGLGLGLSIVKGIVDLHGGTIIAESDGLGKGAEFIVRLPVL